MDRPVNWTRGTNVSTPIPGQNCQWFNVSNGSNSVSLDKLLITVPSLLSVNQELKWIFPLHTYGFACLFFVLSFYTFFSILNLRSLISSRPFMSTINIFLCLLGVSRSGCLFIDPYNLQETMPKVIGSIMWDIGFPCVTSAFCLIQLAFLHLTQLKFGPEKIQKESCLSLVITSHFSCIIASDVALAFHNHFITKYVVQTVFLTWSILLYLTFLHAGYKVMHLLRTMPNNILTRDNSTTNQKGHRINQHFIETIITVVSVGFSKMLVDPVSQNDPVGASWSVHLLGNRLQYRIMQLAMLAPYNNLASSVAAALVPTMLSPKIKIPEENEQEPSEEAAQQQSIKDRNLSKKDQFQSVVLDAKENHDSQPVSTVPEVYVRPPTPTPSTVNLPIITVSSPSRRSSLASRRGSDVSARSSRRNSECSVRFINEEDATSITSDNKRSPVSDRPRTPEGILRRHSEMVTPTGSSKDLRRCSDFSHEKNRSSQFATKLRRNSDFGNRTPKRMLPSDDQRLPRVLDISPTGSAAGSRRNSDFGSIYSGKSSDSRRNSDVPYSRRNSDLAHMRPLNVNRRSSDISIRTLDKSPTHFQSVVPEKNEVIEKSESDSDQPDCNEKAALMNDKLKDKEEDCNKNRKKSLSWKNDKNKDDPEDITAESSLLPENQLPDNRVTGTDFTLHAILNHIAHVNRTKTDAPLYLPEGNSAAAKKTQIKRVLNVTYATAILGIALCIADILRIFGPYGLLGETVKYGTQPMLGQFPRPWPWLIYQTYCRSLELIMGCAMASITKQPSVSPRHQYLNNYRSYSPGIKPRDGLYI